MTRELTGKRVLLVDDTWTTGAHARSAASAIVSADATAVALVVLGRHVRPEWEPVAGSGISCGDHLNALPPSFDWNRCAVCG